MSVFLCGEDQIPFGEYKGFRVGWVLQNNPQYLIRAAQENIFMYPRTILSHAIEFVKIDRDIYLAVRQYRIKRETTT